MNIRLRNRTYENYSLQEYEGKIRDAIIDEIKELNKIAPIVCLFLHKYSMFITTRVITDRSLNCNIMLFYYDRDGGKPNAVNSSNNDIIGPDSVDGVTAANMVYAYIPVSLNKSPFSNRAASEAFNEICDNYTDDLKRFDSLLHISNYDSISSETNKLKQKYSDDVYDILDELPDSYASAKKNLDIDVTFVLKTVFHELTHVLDYSTAATVNHFTGIGIDDVDKHGLELALNVLYMLWSRTEFNAFTQTFGRNIDRPREVVKSSYINKVSVQYLSRPCSDGGDISFDEFLSSLYDKLNELSDVDYDDSFWEAVKTIVANGSNESSAKERFAKMTPQRFRNYFIRTSVSLIEKLKDKVVKNIAAQNSYDKDISNIASSVKDAFNKFLSEYDPGDILDVSFDFDCYFKKSQESYKVYVNVETVDLGRNKTNDSVISNNSVIHITVKQLNVWWDLTPRQLFDKDNNAYSELYKELMTKQRKTKLDRLYINFAEDLNYSVNKLMNE